MLSHTRVPPPGIRRRRRRSLYMGISLPALVLFAAGCGRAGPTIDPAPMKAAIEQYLKQHNMQLRVKEVQDGPVVTGTQATMRVSLTHADLGGPSVVWEFEFEQDAGGKWRAVRHQD